MKIKVTMTLEAIYEPDPKYYDGETDPMKMFEMDKANWERDPIMMWSTFDDDEMNIVVKGEPLG